MPRTWFSLAPAVLSAALLVTGLGACAGVAASPVASTEPPPVSTAPSVSASTTTTSTSTVAPPTTTTLPATTVAPTTAPVDVEAQVAADFLATETASYVCTEDPDYCDASTFAVPGSPTYMNFERFVKRLAEADWRSIKGPSGYVVVEGVVLAPGGLRAELRACLWDDGLIYDPAGTADPSDDIVVDDTHSSQRATFELELTEEGWRRAVTTIDEKVVGENRCPPHGG